MKTIEIDDDLYAFIAGQTKHIGESASQILRRLLMTDSVEDTSTSAEAEAVEELEPQRPTTRCPSSSGTVTAPDSTKVARTGRGAPPT